MRPFSLCVALAVLTLLCVPSSHAGEPETVKILVECAPNDVARVKAALGGLPVKIYVTERTDADGGLEECAEMAPRVPLRSALHAVTALYKSLSDVPREELGKYFQVRKMDVTQRRMSFTVVASSMAALDRVCALVPAVESVRAWAEPGSVAAGAVSRYGGRFKTEFTVALAQGEGPDSARRETMEPLSLEQLHAKAVEAGITIGTCGPERREVQRAGVTHVTREVRFEEAKLDSLLGWAHAIDSLPDLSVVDINWELAEEKEQAPPGQRVSSAAVKVGYAFDSLSEKRVSGAEDAIDR